MDPAIIENLIARKGQIMGKIQVNDMSYQIRDLGVGQKVLIQWTQNDNSEEHWCAAPENSSKLQQEPYSSFLTRNNSNSCEVRVLHLGTAAATGLGPALQV
jgi:hypothetical protein